MPEESQSIVVPRNQEQTQKESSIKSETNKDKKAQDNAHKESSYKLLRGHIKTILQRQGEDSLSDPDHPSNRERFINFAEAFYGGVLKKPGEMKQQLEQEDKFIESMDKIFGKIGELSPVEKRILSSDFVAIFGLIATGSLINCMKSKLKS